MKSRDALKNTYTFFSARLMADYKKQSVSAVFRRNSFIVFFLLIVLTNNIVQAAEGVSVALKRQPSVVSEKEMAKPGQIVQPNQQLEKIEVPITEEVPPVDQKVTRVTEPTKETKQPQIEEEKVLVKVPTEKPFASELFKKAGPILIILFSLIILLLLAAKLKSKQASKVAETTAPPQQPKEEKKEPSNISEAVASFVKRKLKK